MPDKEYIEREAALEECDWYENEFCECEYAIMPLKGALENLPAADVRPVVRGRWRFEKGDGKTCSDGWVCSACNCGFHTNVPYFDDFNFCPNCGADMRGEQDV